VCRRNKGESRVQRYSGSGVSSAGGSYVRSGRMQTIVLHLTLDRWATLLAA
jgi:hypothetical protein